MTEENMSVKKATLFGILFVIFTILYILLYDETPLNIGYQTLHFLEVLLYISKNRENGLPVLSFSLNQTLFFQLGFSDILVNVTL